MANGLTTSSSPSRSYSDPSPRKLPSPPVQRTEPIQARRGSRPLPRIPPNRSLICKKCTTCITSHNVLFPSSSLPLDSRAFRGFSGKASLFTEVYNVTFAPANVQLMTTGAHTMQELTCAVCSSYVGWKIVRAHDHSESWKDGNFLLELEQLYLQPDIIISGDLSSHRQPLSSSPDSQYSL